MSRAKSRIFVWDCSRTALQELKTLFFNRQNNLFLYTVCLHLHNSSATAHSSRGLTPKISLPSKITYLLHITMHEKLHWNFCVSWGINSTLKRTSPPCGTIFGVCLESFLGGCCIFVFCGSGLTFQPIRETVCSLKRRWEELMSWPLFSLVPRLPADNVFLPHPTYLSCSFEFVGRNVAPAGVQITVQILS